MSERVFSFINPNADVMVIPKEEGGTPDDNYFASIGDATAKHVFGLDNSGRQMWESLIYMRSGTLFRTYPNPQDHDQDPFKLKGKDLSNYLEVYKAEVKRNTGKDLSEGDLVYAREAIEEEQARREASSDVYEKNDVIPYHEWQNHPNMWKHIDIPSTPRDRFAYMGNCTQNFYDAFPEDHPDAQVINQCLMILNREWPLDIDEGYLDFVLNWLDDQNIKEYTKVHLSSMASRLCDGIDDPNDIAQEHLGLIDRCWARELLNHSTSHAMRQKMTKVMFHKEKEWETQFKAGCHVYGTIKAFGRVLFQDYRDQMNSWHWALYRRAKVAYCPKLIVRGIDVNRCSLSELKRVFGEGNFVNVHTEHAQRFWCARPFETLEQAHAQGYITSRCFMDSKGTKAIVEFLEKHANIAMNKLSPQHMAEVCKIMLKMQRDKKGDLTGDQWSMLWRYYKILKYEVLTAKQQADNRTKEAHDEERKEEFSRRPAQL